MRGPDLLHPRLSPAAVDRLLVAALLAVDLSMLVLVAPGDLPGHAGPSAVGVAVVAAVSLPLLWRRRAPVAVLAVSTAATLLALAVPVPSQNLASVAALYTVAARCPRRVSLACLAAMAVLVTGVVAALEGSGALPANLLVLATAWVLGDGQRTRAAHAAALDERMRALLADRARAAELAVVEERTRIARDLHDLVGSGIGVMVVQAAAARRVLPTDPEAARTAVGQVVATGRHTLVELRRLLGLLREAGAAPAYEPQPGLADLDALLARCEGAPVRVGLRVDGRPRPLPPGVDLSAYRIVQESLANALRHAGADGIEVRLRWEPDALHVEVLDDGRGPLVPAGPPAPAGHGLVGMRERAALVGGTLDVGARAGGGFRVAARLPLDPEDG